MIYKKSWKYILIRDNSYLCLASLYLYRPKALKDFGDVFKKNLGGYMQSYYNLSQKGNCWIYDNAWVCENARVLDNARVHGESHISGNAVVKDNARVFDDARVSGKAIIRGNTTILHGDFK